MTPMLLLLLGPVVLATLILTAFLPYESFRVAARNGKVGTERSGRRTRRESRHLKRFLRNAVVLPVLMVVIIQSALFTLHYFVVPDTTLSDIFGEYHPDVALNAPDLEAWNEAIERTQRARDFEARERAEGYMRPAKTSLGATMIEHWPLHLIFLILPLAFLTWFFQGHFLTLSQRYRAEVARRNKRYALHTAAGNARKGPHPRGYASPPGMLNENFG